MLRLCRALGLTHFLVSKNVQFTSNPGNTKQEKITKMCIVQSPIEFESVDFFQRADIKSNRV